MDFADYFLTTDESLLDILDSGKWSFEEIAKSRDEKKKIMDATGVFPPLPQKITSPTETMDNSPNITVMVVGKNCTIKEGTELHLKILDFLSWMVMNALENNHGSLSRGGSPLNLLNRGSFDFENDRSFSTSIENLLGIELMTNVKVAKVQEFIDYDTFKDNVKIGIAITLDQSYIDNYVDVEAQRLINNAIKNL